MNFKKQDLILFGLSVLVAIFLYFWAVNDSKVSELVNFVWIPFPIALGISYFLKVEKKVELETEKSTNFSVQKSVTRVYKYSIILGILAAFFIYFIIFNQLSEELLIYLTPLWVSPILFGAGGYLGIGMNKERPFHYALMSGLISFVALFVFFVLIWPDL